MLHQIVKFVTSKGEETLHRDQVAAKQCYLALLCTKATIKAQLTEEEKEVL